MKITKEKSLPLAIGLNLILVGAGYMYMGKWLVGFFTLLLVLGILLTTSINMVTPVWGFLNIIMALDMWILFNKRKASLD